MQELTFQKKVSKGSRFNQIYIPKNMEGLIEVGDQVEVRLINKNIQLHYSPKLKKLSDFKEDLIKKIFSFFGQFNNISQVLIVGSFLTQMTGYHDIDIVLIFKKKDKSFEESLHSKLLEKINLNFHLLVIPQERLEQLLSVCPLTQTMFTTYVSNKKLTLPSKKIINPKHLKFLLMMPEDLLEITLNSRTFFDSLRRLITIEKFLKDQDLDINHINQELNNLISPRLYQIIKNNQPIEKNQIENLRKIIKNKLNKIKKMMING